MNKSRTLTTLTVGVTLLLLPAHGSVSADQVQSPIVSAGSATTTTGSLINVGQSFIGSGRSRTHMMSAGGIPAVVQLLTRPIPGDLDGDRDVDLDDHAIFSTCLNGPDVNTPPLGCTKEQFDLADLHSDQDVDLRDFENLLDVLTAR